MSAVARSRVASKPCSRSERTSSWASRVLALKRAPVIPQLSCSPGRCVRGVSSGVRGAGADVTAAPDARSAGASARGAGSGRLQDPLQSRAGAPSPQNDAALHRPGSAVRARSGSTGRPPAGPGAPRRPAAVAGRRRRPARGRAGPSRSPDPGPPPGRQRGALAQGASRPPPPHKTLTGPDPPEAL